MLRFPPLMTGLETTGTMSPFATAQAQAAMGCDAGLVTYKISSDTLEAAIVFAPEVPLSQAIAMLPTCGVGFQNALGALAPPEIALHLEWSGAIRLNGAHCGEFSVAASTTDPAEIPNWLVVGLSFPIWPKDQEGGHAPHQTALYNEGCADVEIERLLEGWAKHTLVWVNRWQDEGPAPVHAEWRGIAWGMGKPITFGEESGHYLGIDKDFGLLFRNQETTTLVPLTALLEN